MIHSAANEHPTFILLATWNGASFLSQLIQSIQAQTDGRWRVLVRDDGSSDETPAMLGRWAAGEPRVTLLRDDRGRLGSSAGFMLLMSIALDLGAKYFAFCDQDDVWSPVKLRVLRLRIEEAESSSGAQAPVLVWSDLRWIDEQGKTIADSHFEAVGGGLARQGVDPWILSTNLIPGCAMLGNASLLRKATMLGCQPAHHDWWVALVAGAFGTAAAVEASLTDYRLHPRNQIGARSFARLSMEFAKEPLGVLHRAWATYWQAVDMARNLTSCTGSEEANEQWRHWIHHTIVRLGSTKRLTRVGAVLYGPVRRPGMLRSALMLLVAAMRTPSDRKAGC